MAQDRTKPNPQNIRDLRLMYETASTVDGVIESKNLMPSVRNSRDYHEGDIVWMRLCVVPSNRYDAVTVCVQREQVTNPYDGCYRPKWLTDWSKEYTFREFKESPFYQMCIDVWDDRTGLATKLYWDTHLMDDHEVVDDDTRWSVYAHVYEHNRTLLGHWYKTGHIEAVDFSLDEDGNIEMGLTDHGERECFYDGDVWSLRQLIDEHEQMRGQLAKLKEHGIDLDNGTLSIKLLE